MKRMIWVCSLLMLFQLACSPVQFTNKPNSNGVALEAGVPEAVPPSHPAVTPSPSPAPAPAPAPSPQPQLPILPTPQCGSALSYGGGNGSIMPANNQLCSSGTAIGPQSYNNVWVWTCVNSPTATGGAFCSTDMCTYNGGTFTNGICQYAAPPPVQVVPTKALCGADANHGITKFYSGTHLCADGNTASTPVSVGNGVNQWTCTGQPADVVKCTNTMDCMWKTWNPGDGLHGQLICDWDAAAFATFYPGQTSNCGPGLPCSDMSRMKFWSGPAETLQWTGFAPGMYGTPICETPTAYDQCKADPSNWPDQINLTPTSGLSCVSCHW